MRHISRTSSLSRKDAARVFVIAGSLWVIFGLGMLVVWSIFLFNSVPVHGHVIRYENRVTFKGVPELVSIVEFVTRDGQVIQTEFGHSSDLTSAQPLPFEVDLRYTSAYPYQISLAKPTGFYIVGICILGMGLGLILFGRFPDANRSKRPIK